MNDRLSQALALKPHDRVPFVPAIYEHKAWFVSSTPSAISRDADVLTRAMLEEYEQVMADALVVGVDVYNVEAEAVGCRVTYYEGADTSIPAIAAGGEVFHEGDAVNALRIPDPEKDGRMPLMLEVARRVKKEIGNAVPIRGAVSGPFSLAASLAGPEELFMLTFTQPDLARELLAYCAEVIKVFGRAFLRRGCGVIMFDSQASPQLLSPEVYRELVLPPTRDIINDLHGAGAEHVPLIIGGNTTPLLEAYLDTGANNILCDAKADAPQFLATCSRRKRAFRRNIDSSRFLDAEPAEIIQQVRAELALGQEYPGFILGTGVVPYGTPTSILTAIRQAVLNNPIS